MITETNRLILRELQTGDATTLHPVFSDSEATRFTLRKHTTVAETEAWINAVRKGYAKNGFGPWCVIQKSDHAVIGYCGCGIIMLDGHEEYEIGYRILPSHWRQGFASEAASATVNHAFSELSITRLMAVIQPANIASVRVAEKIGMQYERDTTYQGVSVRLYAIEKDE